MGLWLPRLVVADGRSSPQEFGTGEGLQTGTTTSLPPWFLILRCSGGEHSKGEAAIADDLGDATVRPLRRGERRT
jgi:hypothetical protein